ncbi:DegT/DnrJ/EryC1/StrS family aminotransferase [Mumia zhuanghuii]|uniref:DegT/DnrJ/EryC1/StrS family aminotransferase n=2 Tax=Mumia TaxID=1546255 RepID=A0ABW1QKA7_9ACTN|nr:MULTISPECIES: DegT/DnrJ/EryC1/StrS family aminotransferase [Mumia]KAA1425341.1 DegT/DnrJ/EryC1/StrS family aminotransferase [Mumia zhuanghuii]
MTPPTRMLATPVPFARPDITEREIEAVVRTLRGGWVTTGPAVAEFEEEFAAFVGGEVYSVAVSSATAGLHLALEACGIGPGDEVIVPTWTFTATAEVVRYLGAVPVLVDVDPLTLNLDLAAVEGALSPRTRAVVVVHFGGLAADTAGVADLVRGRGIRVVEDAAHALPTHGHGELVGAARHSDAAVFSFYATKPVTAGEGGMLTTRDPAIAERARVMRLHGIDRDAFDRYRTDVAGWEYDVVAPGFKYNLPDPAAAIGRVQLARAHAMRDRRQRVADWYLREWADLPLELPAPAEVGDLHAWHLFPVRLNETAAVDRDGFIDALAARGVGTSVHFIPLHRLTYWRTSLGLAVAQFPVAEDAFSRVVSVPLYSAMSDVEVERVDSVVREVMTS